jgi:GR25 family glycosyltransferase involved in LPS biosynthesis
VVTGIIKLFSSLVLNAFAHYNFSNRIEYAKLRLRWRKPPEVKRIIDKPICIRQIFILSLKTSLNRRGVIKKRFDDEKLVYTVSDGVVGLDTYRFPNAISKRSANYLSRGSIGCWLGHYSIWAEAISRKFEYSMIFEDDIMLAENFSSKLNHALKLVPADFDILFLNSGNNYPHNKRDVINGQAFVPYQIRNGAYGYIVSFSGARKLLSMVPTVQVTRGGIDSAIGSLIRDRRILAYHLNEPLCWVDFSFVSSTK